MALIQGAMCISGTKDLFVFNSDKLSCPQSLFIVTQTLGLISNAFQAWKSLWWNGVKLYTHTHTHTSVQFSRSVVPDSLWPHEPQHARPPCPSPTHRVHPNSCPLSQWCHPTISLPLLSPSPPALNLSQHQGLFKWVSSSHQVAKVLEFQLNISPSKVYPGLIFRTDWLKLLAVQGTLKSLLQYHSSKASILQHSAFFIV